MADRTDTGIKFTRSIGFKMAAALSIGLFAVISVFSHMEVKMTEKRLMKMALTEATKASGSIKSSLEHAMLAANMDTIQAVVSAVGQETMVEDIKIMDINGRVKWARNRLEIGSTLDRTRIKSCSVCHKVSVPARGSLSIVFEKDDGTRILRNVTPIDNKKECWSCHSAERKVIGKLLVDFTIKDTDAMVSESRKMLIFSAAATILSAVLIGMIVFSRLVGNPLGRLFSKVQEVANGNLDAVVEVKGRDEIALLGSFFNDMVHGIKTYIDIMEKEHVNERMTIFNVCEILKRTDSVNEAVNLILNALNIGLNIEECTVLILKDNGKVELNGFIGLPEDKAHFIKDYMETVFEVASMQVSHEYEDVTCMKDERDKFMKDEVFVAPGDGTELNDFIIAPLKAGNRILGAITVHRIKDKDLHAGDIKSLLSIVATAIAPYFHIGLCLDERKTMKVSPFRAFMGLIGEHINRVEEYQGTLSLAVLQVENYSELSGKIGVEGASEKVQDAGVSLSSAIGKVHDITRISEDSIAIILPMIDKTEASEIIDRAAAEIGGDLVPAYKIASYPEDGETPERLMHKVGFNR
ncbi:MAG TPA: hypothetical protein DHW81_01085 [Nitrospiraceae bacterium]|nr:hypothetical protein [Nitrospiraceae bacterium]